ncbi:hypothetical protein F0562_021260 [Nyssa sinensis]|uniref:Uncharacterized protein n=1 Tax=Nyssa sinensis TaxID=561372 RepID=A0A5J5BJD7_9ASTE|nr:hypothetical protein F0562_021260 [Nyssa sinensis]
MLLVVAGCHPPAVDSHSPAVPAVSYTWSLSVAARRCRELPASSTLLSLIKTKLWEKLKGKVSLGMAM